MNNQTIVIVDDRKDVLSAIKEMLARTFKHCSLFTFQTIDKKFYQFVKHNNIDLYIIDIVLHNDDIDGKELACQILQYQSNPIFLFMSGYEYTLTSFCSLKGKAIYDFIAKPVNFNELKNRVSVLLNVSKTYTDLQNNIKTVKHAVWDIVNYSKLFVVLLDRDFKIRLANWFLAKSLGFKNEEQLIGKCWLDFISENEKPLVSELYKIIVTKEDSYYKPGEIITRLNGNKELDVKWFSTYINNTNNLIFNIGIPLETYDYTSAEESIRAYYKDILAQDKTMLESLRDTMFDCSTFSCNICKGEKINDHKASTAC